MMTAKCGVAITASFLAMTAIAWADIGGILSGIMGDKAANADFIGSWSTPSGDIDHIVVSAGASGAVRMQVFGRCEGRICNWGALPARLRTDGPNSQTVVSLAADFNLGTALRHITLHKRPGKMLRFDMVTEFTDGSDRHDYESSGTLTVTAAVPTAATPPLAASSVAAVGSASQFDNASAGGTRAVADDCFAVDTAQAYVTVEGSNWKLRDFLHVVQNFGPYRAAANRGLAILTFYRFDEACRIGRGSTHMSFYRASGEVPHQAMAGEDCLDVHPDKVQAVLRDDDWTVVEGAREIYNYASDKSRAEQAVQVVKSLNLTRQCYFDRANLSASYWLSR